ncbi:type II toxin-antitoxin system VapC family toxin [Sphingomonas sp. PB4P5]|uniref:type II toxin-antitoxin system VapC family toxin n=1 Tax=Parasphingomonas puruogangriensis TaxID=3096155 RepID=UPI002FC89AE3
MLVADSSVWIDFLNRNTGTANDRLDDALEAQTVILIDIIATEVLQGIRLDRDFAQTLRLFDKLPLLATGGMRLAVEAARNYRTLRERGITIRKTVDTLIATRCIIEGIPLLYRDRDFDPFVAHLGLISAMDAA